MFGLGIPEVVIIALIFMIVFGAGKLPGVMAQFGKGLKEFRDSVSRNDK
jgi:sec-independent protein translocase protein TatA